MVDTPFNAQVEVLTWGSKINGGSGIFTRVKKMLYGGNLGHAALRITVPATPENKELIEANCEDIPYVNKKLPNGNDVYEIYISAWPGNAGGKTVSFKTASFKGDREYGRTGTHFSWDPKWLKKLNLNPEKRSHKGLWGATEMSYGPQGIAHGINLSKEQLDNVKKIADYKTYLSENSGFQLLLQRIEATEKKATDTKKKVTLSKTEKNLLNRYVPGWKEGVKNPSSISLEEMTKLKSLAEQKHEEFENNHQELMSFINQKKNVSDITLKRDEIYFVINSIEAFIKGKIKETTLKKRIQKYITQFDTNKSLTHLLTYDLDSKQNISDILTAFENEKEKVIQNESEFDQLAREYDEITLRGTPPDHVVTLPIGSSTKQGLNLEKMLAKANDLDKGNIPFDIKFTSIKAFKRANCSKVANWILKAGAQNTPLQKIFENEILGVIATPQTVFNNALKYQSNLLKKLKIKTNKNTEISYDKTADDIVISPMKFSVQEINNKNLQQALNEFKQVVEKGDKIPCFHPATQRLLNKAILKDSNLAEQYYDLCNQALHKMNKQSLQPYKLSASQKASPTSPKSTAHEDVHPAKRQKVLHSYHSSKNQVDSSANKVSIKDNQSKKLKHKK